MGTQIFLGNCSEDSYCKMLPGKIHWVCQGPGHVFGVDSLGMVGGGIEVFWGLVGWRGGERTHRLIK